MTFGEFLREIFKWLYRFYFTRLLPVAGRLISKHSHAYTYLPESVLRFARPGELGTRLRAAGFEAVDWRLMTKGIACLWWGRKPSAP